MRDIGSKWLLEQRTLDEQCAQLFTAALRELSRARTPAIFLRYEARKWESCEISKLGTVEKVADLLGIDKAHLESAGPSRTLIPVLSWAAEAGCPADGLDFGRAGRGVHCTIGSLGPLMDVSPAVFGNMRALSLDLSVVDLDLGP